MKKIFNISNAIFFYILNVCFQTANAQFSCSSVDSIVLITEPYLCSVLVDDYRLSSAAPLSSCSDDEPIISQILIGPDMKPYTGRRRFTPGKYRHFWDSRDACGGTIRCPFDLIVRFPDGITNCSQIATKTVANNTMCGNGDFESGVIDLGEWCLKDWYLLNDNGRQCNFSISQPNMCDLTVSSGALNNCDSRHTIVSKGNDPIVNILTVAPTPIPNNHALRIGNSLNGYGIETISKEFLVTAGATSLSFWYACVFNNGHQGTPSAQPGFIANLESISSSNNLDHLIDLGHGSNLLISDVTDPFFYLTTIYLNGDLVIYKDWSCVTVDLSNHVNEIVKITFTNKDCAGGLHFGYTYLDNVCIGCPSGDVVLAKGSSCLPGDICVDYTLPSLNGNTGQCKFFLEIFRNGNVVYSNHSPFQTSGTNYCFTVDSCMLLDEDMYDYRIRMDCSVPAPPCPLTPPPLQNPIHLPVQYVGVDSFGIIPGLNNDIATCCLNCCDSVIISKTDSCCSHLESICEVSTINISVANGTISDLFWNCGAIPSGYLGSSNFTYSPTTACPLALDICVSPVGLNPVIITYTITFIDGSNCVKTESKNCPCAQISGLMWHDANNNGIKETGEPPLMSMVELLSMPGPTVYSTTPTGINGDYVFNCMPPGNYAVRFTPPLGYEATLQNVPPATTDSDINTIFTTATYGINNGDTLRNIDAGLFYCCDYVNVTDGPNRCCSKISSLCRVDSMYISVLNGTLSTVSWSCLPRFNNHAWDGLSSAAIDIPNNCPLEMIVCANPIYTNPYAPIIINYHLDLANGGVCSKSDTLYCPCAVIKGEVWHDANANGLNENATENGINGLEVELVDAMSGQVVSTSITQKNPITPSDDGYYNFPCVKPGMYYVRFDSLPNYTNTLTNQGSNDQIDSDITNVYGYYTTNKITVNNGDTICDLDGGFKDTLITSTSFFVQGFAKFGETKPMPYVNTILFDKVSRVSKSTLTDLRGAYSFYDLSSASNYEIRLNFEDDYLSGVTTYDILQIQKHILGINEFSSPYKFIAADVNQTKTITAADISEIRKLILGVIPSFPKTKSWKFVNKNRMDPLYPMLSQEYADINISTLDKNNVNFEAVKMGDVNSSALFTDGAQTRTSQTLKLIGHTVIKGTTMKVSYQSLEELCVNGIQLGLTLPNGLKVNQIHFCGEKISENNYTHIVDELRISHNQMEMCTPKSNNFLLEIEFDIKTPVDEYEILQKVDFISEVYGCQNVIYPIEIIAETKANNFEITHIVPTVFSSEIEIGIFSNSSNMLQLDIYNTSGTNIYSNKFQITKSYSRNLIKDLDSVPPGVYVMHFQVGNSTKLRKIIKM